MIETLSLCPECYAHIPAVVYEKDGAAWMTKICPTHGEFEAMVERSFKWWDFCQKQEAAGIYEGYFIDLTPRCNLTCKYCFHDQNGKDRSVEDICEEMSLWNTITGCSPILFGGEPTIHNHFLSICNVFKQTYGSVAVVTNGTRTADNYFFKRMLPFMKEEGRDTSIHVSIHPESDGADLQTLENARKNNVKIGSILYVIDSLDQVKDAVELFDSYSDVVNAMRLKAASNVWAENKAPKRLFVSDMLDELGKLGSVSHVDEQMTTFCNVKLDDRLHIMPVSWYDTANVDLNEIKCAPWYKAKDGHAYNLLTSFLVNEGIDKGYYQGEKIEDLTCAA